MNIPIDGTADSFVLKLKDKGFKGVDSLSPIIRMTGNFLGSENAIFIYSNPSTKVVYKIEVDIENAMRNYILYFDFKDLFIAKYGKCSEEFTYSLFDWSRKVTATWSPSFGTISMYYGSSKTIVINYIDGVNYKNYLKQSSNYRDI